jgi:hypothetical protein
VIGSTEPLLTCIVSGRYEGDDLEELAAAMYEKRQAQAPLVFGGDIESSVGRSKAFPLLAISSQRRLTARHSGSLLRQSLALNVTLSRSSMPQSPLATRVRTHDIAKIAGTYAHALPQLLSLGCWGATSTLRCAS